MGELGHSGVIFPCSASLFLLHFSLDSRCVIFFFFLLFLGSLAFTEDTRWLIFNHSRGLLRWLIRLWHVSDDFSFRLGRMSRRQNDVCTVAQNKTPDTHSLSCTLVARVSPCRGSEITSWLSFENDGLLFYQFDMQSMYIIGRSSADDHL